MEDKGLAYVGLVLWLEEIPDATAILSATVVCGKGGKWKGVVRKGEFKLGDLCVVFLPDALLPECDGFRFMESRGWRVKMCKFRGVPSEVLIMQTFLAMPKGGVGTDITQEIGVKKYYKPIPANLQGIAKGDFPSFVPKTDELNWQRHSDLVKELEGKSYYITTKMDGSSTTAYKHNGEFGVCSRNLELVEDDNNGYWQLANKYKLKELLPEGIALQWETCGPKIQKNPMGLPEITAYAFSAYNIRERVYLTFGELNELCKDLQFAMVDVVGMGDSFSAKNIGTLGEGTYPNGNQREGVVVRSKENLLGDHPISLKVINLNYEK